MVDHDEDEDLQMALRMSLQGSPPEAKRSKPIEAEPPGESPEAKERRLQRELRASAAERRISMMAKTPTPAVSSSSSPVVASPLKPSVPMINHHAVAVPPRVMDLDKDTSFEASHPGSSMVNSSGQASQKAEIEKAARVWGSGEEITHEVAGNLFTMLFGSNISQGILSRWCNQGIRFSSDPDTCIGLVQHEGGPCGVLAAIQAYVLKYLIFFPEALDRPPRGVLVQNFTKRNLFQSSNSSTFDFSNMTEDMKIRALSRSMLEILFLCGSKRRAVIATLDIFKNTTEECHDTLQEDEVVSKALEGLALESAADFHKAVRLSIYVSETSAYNRLQAELPVYRSRMGAMLFLISALLSRGLDSVQADRDDPSLPLVTAPFGHASQEIVNLLLCGQAAPNVFDGSMDLGGGMSLKGIPSSVEVGFLTLLESLNFCKVGQNLKCPKWPIWVVGSESHYSVLFALDKSVQDENELELRESRIHRAFDAHDQSGGGGFISVESFDQVLRDTGINLPPDKLDNLRSMGFIVWSEFWQVLLEVDKSLGGMKDSALGKKQFEIYHFNGIAKSVLNGGSSQVSGSEASPTQRPRLCKLTVSVPPRWTQEEYMADVHPGPSSGGNQDAKNGDESEVNQPSQHCPLVDCIRTRWPRATCRWVGDPPSIV